MKTLDFNMSAEYCSDWSYLDALREVVQNALDLDEDSSTYTIDDKAIAVATFGSSIPMECFTLGMSNKAEGAIGKYGEGLKLAMMILARLDANPTIITGKYTIVGKFLLNSITGVDTFNLVFTELENAVDSVFFSCDLLPEFDVELIKERITPFGEFLGKPSYFDILEGSAGEIYVNGLYVCTDKSLDRSYNFAPDVITLNRDRNMVEGVDSTLSYAYANYGKAKDVFELLEAEAKDVCVIQYYLTYELSCDLKDLYVEKYGDSPIAQTGKSYVSGNSVSLGHTAYSVFRSVGIKEAETEPNPLMPSTVLAKFAAENKSYMRRDFRLKFDALIKESSKWRQHDVY